MRLEIVGEVLKVIEDNKEPCDGWGSGNRIVLETDDLGEIKVCDADGNAVYGLRIDDDGDLILTQYKGNLTMSVERNLCLKQNRNMSFQFPEP